MVISDMIKIKTVKDEVRKFSDDDYAHSRPTTLISTNYDLVRVRVPEGVIAIWRSNIRTAYYYIDKDGATKPHSTCCTGVQAGYQVDELWGYSAEDQDSSD